MQKMRVRKHQVVLNRSVGGDTGIFVFLAIMRGTNGLIQGVGNAKLSLVLGILDGVVVRMGFSWLFGIFLNWGFFGFVLGYGLAPFGVAVPGLIYFFSGKWKTRKALV